MAGYPQTSYLQPIYNWSISTERCCTDSLEDAYAASYLKNCAESTAVKNFAYLAAWSARIRAHLGLQLDVSCSIDHRTTHKLSAEQVDRRRRSVLLLRQTEPVGLSAADISSVTRVHQIILRPLPADRRDQIFHPRHHQPTNLEIPPIALVR